MLCQNVVPTSVSPTGSLLFSYRKACSRPYLVFPHECVAKGWDHRVRLGTQLFLNDFSCPQPPSGGWDRVGTRGRLGQQAVRRTGQFQPGRIATVRRVMHQRPRCAESTICKVEARGSIQRARPARRSIRDQCGERPPSAYSGSAGPCLNRRKLTFVEGRQTRMRTSCRSLQTQKKLLWAAVMHTNRHMKIH